MTKNRVSIKDIAARAGVTHPTVSRALNDSPLVSDATRMRIKRIASEMGYTPDAVAQSLQTKRTNIVGLVVTSIDDPFFADVVRGVEEVARPAGFSVFLNSSHNDADQEIQVIETFHRQRVDGILAASSRIGENHISRLKDINVPVVLINSQAEGDHGMLHSIAVDDQLGARRAVEHLIERGHRRIGYIGLDNRPRSNTRRRRGYYDALEEAGIEAESKWEYNVDATEADTVGDAAAGESATSTLFESDVTAIFCYNDMTAIGALQACRHAQKAVPDDISIVGFDDIDIARFAFPPLTSVHQPMREMGRAAMEALVALLDGEELEDQILEPVVTVRESTGSPHLAIRPS